MWQTNCLLLLHLDITELQAFSKQIHPVYITQKQRRRSPKQDYKQCWTRASSHHKLSTPTSAPSLTLAARTKRRQEVIARRFSEEKELTSQPRTMRYWGPLLAVTSFKSVIHSVVKSNDAEALDIPLYEKIFIYIFLHGHTDELYDWCVQYTDHPALIGFYATNTMATVTCRFNKWFYKPMHFPVSALYMYKDLQLCSQYRPGTDILICIVMEI